MIWQALLQSQLITNGKIIEGSFSKPHQGVVSLTFRELSNIIPRKYTTALIKFMMRISIWNLASGTRTQFQLEIHIRSTVSVIHKFRENIMMTPSNGNIFRVTGPLGGEFTGPGEFPTQRPVTRSFDVFFDLRLNKRLSKQPWGWWFETQSWSLWRQCNVLESSRNVSETRTTGSHNACNTQHFYPEHISSWFSRYVLWKKPNYGETHSWNYLHSSSRIPRQNFRHGREKFDTATAIKFISYTWYSTKSVKANFLRGSVNQIRGKWLVSDVVSV